MPALVKLLCLVISGAGLVIGLAAAATYVSSEGRLNERIDVPAESIAIPTDISTVQRGQHLASAVAACAACHGNNSEFAVDKVHAR